MKKIVIILLILSTFNSRGQFIKNFSEFDSTLNSGKIRLIATGLGVGYVGSTTALSILWYDTLGGFRWFNDNPNWNQIDKLGHSSVAFHESRLAIDLLRWAGVENKKAILIGGLGGFIFQTPIEILDGFSPTYGASWGDIIANTTGAALATSQQLLWNDIYIHPKFSFHRTSLASKRPNTLGNGLNEEILKDYNGQTYWLSFNLFPLLNSESRYPKWLNIAVGYGANNMLFGNEKENNLNGYTSYRQWYISPDIDLTRIKTKKRGIKILLYSLNILKIPAPTLEYSKYGLKGHFLYF